MPHTHIRLRSDGNVNSNWDDLVTMSKILALKKEMDIYLPENCTFIKLFLVSCHHILWKTPVWQY